MRVMVNGQPHDFSDGATIADVVAAVGQMPEGRGIAVAVGGEVVPRGRWDAYALDAGAAVEVVVAVQGG